MNTNKVVLAFVVLVVVLVMYPMPVVENYVSSPTSRILHTKQVYEPTTEFPILLYPLKNCKGVALPLKPRQEVTVFEFNRDGVMGITYDSLKLLAGKKVMFRAYHANNSMRPSQTIAEPRGNVIHDFDAYLRQDPFLKQTQGLGYNPGSTRNARFTIEVV